MSVESAIDIYKSWLESPYFDEETKEELRQIKDDEKEITERFYADLEFGTAGLRGIIGAGTNRMNKYTVRKASQGLANYIIKSGKTEKGVAVAYDSRHFSPDFALEAALCFAANGIKAYLFESLRPTPELSFSVRYLSTAAGVNITASHNPAKYNGYKVYWEDGAQITPPHDTGIMDCVKAVTDWADVKTMNREDAIKAGLLQIIGAEVDDAFIENVKAQVKEPQALKAEAKNIKIVYTPLHGAGNIPVRRVLSELGFTQVYVVPEQEKPDGNFPTVPYPNPEADKAFELGLKLAKEVDADIVLATDPDSDRLGVRVKDAEGKYHAFDGNQSGAFLADYEIGRLKAGAGLPDDGVLISTIVTGKMGRAVANYYGVDYKETLTGFKYIGEQIKIMEEKGHGHYLFGYEESYGCFTGTYARDKDAVVASMALCEATAYYKSKGMTLWDAMIDMYERLGYFSEGTKTAEFEGIEGKEKMAAIMEKVRAAFPSEIGGYKVIAKRDYKTGIKTCASDGSQERLSLPSSNVIIFDLEDDAWCCIRPSGTEPKIKLYYGVKGSSIEDASALEDRLAAGFAAFTGVE